MPKDDYRAELQKAAWGLLENPNDSHNRKIVIRKARRRSKRNTAAELVKGER